MIARLLVVLSLAAGGALPAAAGDVRWIDPWGAEVEHRELAGGPKAVDPWAGERGETQRAEVASVATAGFEGGVGNRQSFIAIHNGFYVKPSFAAGQTAMTGARAAPVHPRGGAGF